MANLKITDESIRDSFPELWKVLEDDEVTDFDFNCGNIWFSTVSALPKQIVDSKLDAPTCFTSRTTTTSSSLPPPKTTTSPSSSA